MRSVQSAIERRGERTMVRSWKVYISTVAVCLLCLSTYGLGVATGPAVQRTLGVGNVDDGLPTEFRSLLQVWELVSDHFVEQSRVDPKAMVYAAIPAMLATLKDTGHTRFLTAEEYKRQQEHFQGQFSGIGATVDIRDHRPVIVAPVPGSPAEKAGLLPNDIILSIDGRDTTDLPLDQATKLIRGQRGTKVALRIQRSGGRELDIPVTRDVIPIITIRWQIIQGSDIAVISITEFSDGTAAKLETALDDARRGGAKRFVIDVRDDPGGLLDQAVAVSSAFIQSGVVLVQQDAKGHRQNYNVNGHTIAPSEPVAVLVNKGSASASEIFAGAMQDHERARVIGVSTYGTGTVLSTYQLKDGSALLLGTLKWLTPSGRTIKDQGIAPDDVVTMPESIKPIFPGTRDFPESVTAAMRGTDLQLAAAVRTLDPSAAVLAKDPPSLTSP